MDYRARETVGMRVYGLRGSKGAQRAKMDQHDWKLGKDHMGVCKLG